MEPPIGQGDPDISIASHTLISAHKTDTAVTFKPKSFKALDNLIRSQLESFTTVPPETPITVEEIAPDTGTAQMSVPIAVNDGAIAVGGGCPL
jgi:hypothetical protein